MNCQKKMKRPDMGVSVGALSLKNPVMTSSGTGGYGEVSDGFADLSKLGAFVTKGLSLLPREGNPPPRLVETSCGLLNAIGLANCGIDAFLEDKLPRLIERGVATVVNFFGETEDEYEEMAARLSRTSGISALEMNVSCPNVNKGGMAFGIDPETLFQLVKKVRKKCDLPLFVKLSPNVTDISLIARATEAAGADTLTVANTFTGMAIDAVTRRPLLANITGGLSGPAIKSLTMRLVWETVRSVRIPVIAVGGIMEPTDAIEYLIVGAKAVQIGTANFVNPGAFIDIVEGIEEYIYRSGIDSVEALIGTLET
jgi:dihydroorotate dehydrogenase (NAD+) catalytic subunit